MSTLVDAVSFVANAAGAGAFVFGAARPSFRTPTQAALIDGVSYSYLAQDSLSSPTQREWGTGTYSQSGNSLARTTVLGTVNNGVSGSGSALSFSVAPIVSLTALAAEFRIKITSAFTVYVATTGSDVTGNGTLANPWATCQFAFNWLVHNIDPGGFAVNIQLADGTYDMGGSSNNFLSMTDDDECRTWNMNGSLRILGNAGNMDAVIVQNGGTFVEISEGDAWNISLVVYYFQIKNFTYGFFVQSPGTLFVNSIHFVSVTRHFSNLLGIFDIAGPIVIDGNFVLHHECIQGQIRDFADYTFNSTPAISNEFIICSQYGAVEWNPNSVTGTCTGKKFFCFSSGWIVNFTSSVAMPGSVAGVISSGGTVQDLNISHNAEITFHGVVGTTPVTVSNLVVASYAGVGARAFVTDSTQTLSVGLGTTVVGGSTNKVPVYSDGTSWLIG
jgi:hypothetical protein